MGKLINFLVMLIFIDMLFLATGQICIDGDPSTCTLSSIIFSAITDINNIVTSNYWTQLLGSFTGILSSTTGAFSLGAGAVVIAAGALLSRTESLIWLLIAAPLALLTADFVFISSILIAQNSVLGLFIMVPVILIYTLTVIEWARNKD